MFFRPEASMRKTNLGNIKFFFIIAFSSGVLIGCNKTEGTLNIKGTVIDESTKAGIPWKNIIVQGLRTNNDKSEAIEAGQLSTDSIGGFTYTLRKVKDARYYNFCMVGDTNYVFTIRTLGLRELDENAKFLTFPLSKLTDLTIKLTRKSKMPFCDTIRLIWESNGVFGGSLYPYKIIDYGRTNNSIGLKSDLDLIWIGGKVNATINTKVFAEKKTELTWELYRNGRRRQFIDTITCKRDVVNIVYFAY
jgi:hypothetical protein